jgi:ComF family protein
MRVSQAIQTAVTMIYPPRCLTCGSTVDTDFGLCGSCWRDTTFVGGTICDGCGVPLPGDLAEEDVHCDDCIRSPRPWVKGRSALLYNSNGRRLVLAFKHGDRQEIARPAALWMMQAIRDIPKANLLIAPVPLHWTRLVKRRYNQSALLAQELARAIGLPVCPDLLMRHRRTESLDGKSREARFSSVRDAIKAHPKRRHRLIGRPILLVDDVLTSGATLSTATDACLAAGSGPVYVVTLARVTKDT